MAKKEKKDKKSIKIGVQFVQLKSLEDLARNATTFSGNLRPIFAMKNGSSFRMFEQGPSFDDVRIIFYFDSKKAGNFLTYRPGMLLEIGKTELNETVSMQPQVGETRNIPIIEIKSNPFEENTKALKAANLMVKDLSAMIKGTITRSMESESIGKVYAFRKGKQTYIGSFNLLEEEDTKIFCYAKADLDDDYSFFRYNYERDKVEPTNTFGEHPYLYVRVINLTEPFSFFKSMPD